MQRKLQNSYNSQSPNRVTLQARSSRLKAGSLSQNVFSGSIRDLRQRALQIQAQTESLVNWWPGSPRKNFRRLRGTTATMTEIEMNRLTDLSGRCGLVWEPFESSVVMRPSPYHAIVELPWSPSRNCFAWDDPFSSSSTDCWCCDEGMLLLYTRRRAQLVE